MTEDKERPLGEWLRQRREDLGISLEQVEEDTRIRVRYLHALENENFEALPDPVVGRGFLRNYAAYLEMNLDEVTARYSQVVPGSAPAPVPVREPSYTPPENFHPVPLHEMPGFRPRRGLLVVGVLVLIAALVTLGWFGYPYVLALLYPPPAAMVPVAPTATLEAQAQDVPTATLVAEDPTATASPLPTATEAEATATLELTLTPTFTASPSPSPSPPVYTGIFLELVLSDTSWMQVTVDDVRQFQGELAIGTYRSWYGQDRIVLRIGNAGAVQVTVNGQKLGALGTTGEVVDRIFEKVGDQVTEVVSTPGVTGTITVPLTGTTTILTATPPVTAQPTLSPTVQVSSTATASAIEPIRPTVGP